MPVNSICLAKYLNKSFPVSGEPVEPPFDELRASGIAQARQAQCERRMQTSFQMGT
jgi:hypothetical protein